ncbi:MAG: aldo/keto reductase [bacterium]
MNISKVGFGTAQIGMPYGINNKNGQPSPHESREILEYALENGVSAFDTSPEYGTGEEILGEVLSSHPETVLISKVPPTEPFSKNGTLLNHVDYAIELTLNRVRRLKLDIYLFHRFDDLFRDDHVLLKHLLQWRQQGVVQKIGVSVYTPQEAERALQLSEIEVLQIPFNLLDKRWLANGILTRASQRNVLVLARSVFLQGLLFKRDSPDFLNGFYPYQKKILEICRAANLSLAELALRYVLSFEELTSVILGMENLTQVQENLKMAKKGGLPLEILNQIKALGTAPRLIIDPRLWQRH